MQDVEGLVSVAVSFANGAPPLLLLKCVDSTNYSPADIRAPDAAGLVDYGSITSIPADFHVLDGLKVDIIFREDLPTTANAFVRHSADFSEKDAAFTAHPGQRPCFLVNKVEKWLCSAVGKQNDQIADVDKKRDIAGSREDDRYETKRFVSRSL